MKRRLSVGVSAGVILAILILMGCATIMHGTSQEIGIQSTPSGAAVSVDNKPLGTTPVVAKLSRKDTHTVTITLDGYYPYEANIVRSTSGWVWGNIVFGGLVGLAVDAISGGLYKLKPDEVEAQLRAQGVQGVVDGTDFVIAVVLEPDPSWEKVGSLVPSSK
jgi:hypothetical protein